MDQKVDWEDKYFHYKRKYQQFCDRITPKFQERWAAVGALLFFLLIRILVKQGYAVITYLLGLFYLNNLMLYLAPIDDPED
jgi:hypothetical protein